MFYIDQSQGCPPLEGRILMLPKKADVEDRIPATLAIDSGIFNHPVVVLSKKVYQGKVAVYVLTSFDNTPIENRHRDPVRRQSYLPIRPASHPDTGCVLIPAHGKAMKKQSYVNTKVIHEIPFKVLRNCWRDNDLHLEKESYRILASTLWKQNVAELAMRLKGHGIFEQVQHPRTPTITIPTIATTSNARAYDYPRGTYGSFQPVPPRIDHVALQQNRLPTQQWTNNQAGNNNDAGGTGCGPVLIIIICLLLGAWYWSSKH